MDTKISLAQLRHMYACSRPGETIKIGTWTGSRSDLSREIQRRENEQAERERMNTLLTAYVS